MVKGGAVCSPTIELDPATGEEVPTACEENAGYIASFTEG